MEPAVGRKAKCTIETFPSGFESCRLTSIMSLPQTAARRGVRTVCLVASGFLLASILPQLGASNLPLTCSPTNLQFGDVQVGGSRTLTAAMTNTGPASLTVSSGNTIGNGFAVSGMEFPLSLEPGHSFTFRVTFSPESAGMINGSIQLAGAEGTILEIPLAGMGKRVGELISYPSDVNFGSVPVGKRSLRRGVLTAKGASVTVYSANSDSSEFTPLGLSFPFTISPGQVIPYALTFHPERGGKASGLISFRTEAMDSGTVLSLAGDGTAPETYTVYLSWQASLSQVIGYNVYRGVQSGGPYSMINSGLDPNTSYIDNSVDSGYTYYYVTTAVNSSGQESVYSNQAQATIP